MLIAIAINIFHFIVIEAPLAGIAIAISCLHV